MRSGNAGEQERVIEQEGERVSETEQKDGYCNRGALYISTRNKSSNTSTINFFKTCFTLPIKHNFVQNRLIK